MLSEDRIRLQHILEEAKEALLFVEGYLYNDFIKDNKTVHAVMRCIEIIGEAAAKLTNEYKEEHSSVPWNQIVGMRNHLIHVYFDVDHKTLWKTIQEDIPELISVFDKLLKKE